MGEKKPIRHMGMTMTDPEHRQWHREHDGKDLTAEEHRKLMEHLGISPEQDRAWHQAQEAGGDKPGAGASAQGKAVNPFAIGGGFLEYCVRQAWLTRQGRGRATKYYVTEMGREALAGFGITKY